MVKTNMRSQSNASAFTLVEILISMVLFAVLAAGISQTILFMRHSSTAEAEAMSAFSVGSAYMEQLLALPYSVLRAAEGGSTPITLIAGDGSDIQFVDGTTNSDSRMNFEINMLGRQTSRSKQIDVTIDITAITDEELLQLVVTYEWVNTHTGKTVTHDLRAIKNDIL